MSIEHSLHLLPTCLSPLVLPLWHIPFSDDEDASVASRRAALYSANTVAQITSKKDTEPDRMEIDNSFGKFRNAILYACTLQCYRKINPLCICYCCGVANV